MRSARITIDHFIELSLTLSAIVDPGSPGCTSGPPDRWEEPSGPEIDDVRVELTPDQERDVAAVLAATRFPIEDRAAFVTDILRALDPEFGEGDSIDEAFVVAHHDAEGREHDLREDRRNERR